ncbi:uncharacterized protein ARB_07377 [Trichophyton benhamiae CBS 112371]|uniref:Uncharacterized protein n=1 Tax=Arthroderma benhamiae (strain ATCC MYA-4681 / CBS 112371) TaxID=663331 RepID=D4AT13_ARTBC|nr:uncharacterized protein ARB_07377 [Trichophyton benhamiae CBS 112371]EFE33913.1 hypothetical protein ARB_07377 [Trichophyton benhamiae CBS 112371]
MKKLRNTESPQHMRKTITEGKGKRRSRRSRNFFLFYILRREAANFFTYKAQFLSWRAKEDALRVVIKDIEEDMAEGECDIIQFWHLWEQHAERDRTKAWLL